jgi:hypothetical protein
VRPVGKPPVPPEPQGAPASVTLPAASHFAQLPDVPVAGAVTVFAPAPLNVMPRLVLAVAALERSLRLLVFCKLLAKTAAAAPEVSKLNPVMAFVIAVRVAFSLARFVSVPGDPTEVTREVLEAVPSVGVPLSEL